ncbi:ABC transporter ATP-binding protein [Malaciobacter pacificus]|jgi:ATPase subunit of ABC transporter with duplicated ATPase domains|uniref:Probable ATP-binding protein YbiT n=1 Tax=Malaciobacter pacificus TaxID=1080223 RepID=A0A5C2HDC2_9BACT|nr:ABC-F family ATP-binding cassette domain-containing protein [Malaciobacter pacificus]QEP34322.1 ABC transporter, ATP-binding protein [Malaciobacter pacificus]GGD48050.1 ABC transporter ATP-binding protein [Malaciobacter pacificus]
MVQTVNLKKAFGPKVLFQDINIKLDTGKRYGLIGANGAGKTTFLKILSGEEDATEGEVQVQSGKKVGTLSQNQFAYEEYTIFDTVLKGNPRLFDAIKEKEKLYMSEEFTDEINERLGELEIICCEEDPTYEYDIKITKILEDLGFPADQHQDLMSTITGGDKFKVLLAQVLYPKPDVLFLDEPTNNLDIETIGWLENQLQHHEGTMVVISHDRHFLNAVCTHILDVDYKQIREFTGNYDDWYIASTVIAKQQNADRDKKLKEKEELEKFIARFSANASKAKQATSRQKQLDKLDVGAIQLSSRRDPSIIFRQKREVGKELLSIKDISKSYDGETVLKDISFTVDKDDKIALIGPNGIGKTTLCEIIVENIKPDSGEVHWGATIEKSYFPQNATDIIKGDMTLYDWLRSFDRDADISEIRNCLGRMLFNGQDQEKKVEKCSGGEKHRMMLSKIMLEQGNFLVLDEPTNHLDLEAIIALGEGLLDYPGSVICVSHDRELLDAYANRIIEIQADGSIVDFKGSYEEYLETKVSK